MKEVRQRAAAVVVVIEMIQEIHTDHDGLHQDGCWSHEAFAVIIRWKKEEERCRV
jgi:hypothetical protein